MEGVMEVEGYKNDDHKGGGYLHNGGKVMEI